KFISLQMLSIIITHYKTPALLKLCLNSIQKNIGDFKYEIIVVDSQSEDDTRELIEEKFPEVKIIYFIKNVGYAKIVNAGIKAAKGNYILILNADILMLKKAVSRMAEFMESHFRVGVIGPQLLTFSNEPQNSCFSFPNFGALLARRTFLGKLKWGKKKLNRFLMKNENLSVPKNVDWVQGSAMFVRQNAIKKVGLLDERFFMYFEDMDWCRRFWQNGYSVVYLPTAQMSHYYYRVSKKWGGILDIFFNKYTRLHLISAFKYFRKWRGSNSKINSVI
ncbi:MAG: glycosyltransferase family 2 protein, partial [Patescibacteria group bacterium]|nr:glycosyltransferase family 2 protein [Patescibacteria group bacterium]